MNKKPSMAPSHTGQPNAQLRRFKINAVYQGRPVLTATGAAYDFGDGATCHNAIFDSIHDIL